MTHLCLRSASEVPFNDRVPVVAGSGVMARVAPKAGWIGVSVPAASSTSAVVARVSVASDPEGSEEGASDGAAVWVEEDVGDSKPSSPLGEGVGVEDAPNPGSELADGTMVGDAVAGREVPLAPAVGGGRVSVPDGVTDDGTVDADGDGLTAVGVAEPAVGVGRPPVGVRVGTVWRRASWPGVAHELGMIDAKMTRAAIRTATAALPRNLTVGVLLIRSPVGTASSPTPLERACQ